MPVGCSDKGSDFADCEATVKSVGGKLLASNSENITLEIAMFFDSSPSDRKLSEDEFVKFTVSIPPVPPVPPVKGESILEVLAKIDKKLAEQLSPKAS